MKKLLVISVTILMTLTVLAASPKKGVEVLYFKAQLSCCQARACNTLENDIKTLIAANFDASKVTFTEILLTDEKNKALIEQYKAKSQTVVVVNAKKKKTMDVSDLVRTYLRNGDKATFEKELIQKIKNLK
ncbi:MAG: hypothetical protein PHI42_04890 [Paludibacteraceae bacterium]|nr:hypothetical protein [Paludibacteraceae bacterium]